MMHVVPSCASPVPYFSPSYSPESYSPESPPDLTFEFDLNLLPSSDCADVVPGLDLPLPIPTDPFQEVPSPSSSFTFLDSSLHSPTMFSPVGGGNEKTPLYSSYMMDPNSSSPISLPPSSPYSPGKFSLTLQQGNILQQLVVMIKAYDYKNKEQYTAKSVMAIIITLKPTIKKKH